MRELSSRLLRIQEDERRAISREIHDDFGQQVTAINLDLKLAQRSMEASAARSHLERAVGGNETLLKSLHAFATRVRPAVLDDLGVHDAVESHLDEFQQRSGICVTASLEFDAHALPDEIVDNAYRLLQESLNNVLKHANATRVWVAMTIEPDDPPHFLLSVRDNGQGYEANGIGGGLGLIGMRERVELLGGKIHLQSDADSGTVIEIELPLRAQHGESEIP